MPEHVHIPPPLQLPAKLNRTRLGGTVMTTLTVKLKTITPVMGGGTKTRSVDDVDIFRPPTIRGHLRFWWRAVHGHKFDGQPRKLAAAERALWGGMADNEQGSRSDVEIGVTVYPRSPGEDVTVAPILPRNADSYALWPAMEISNQGLDTAPRRNPGREFSLAIRCPQAREDEVKAAVRAWIMFGGYGGRTRRGCGSLTVTGDASAWLPVTADCTSLQLLLGNGVFCAAPIIPMSDLPLLRGAELWAGPATANANAAWTTALGWLREFRQGSGSDPALHAREPAPPTDPNRPSLSRWPEADKMRHMYIARGYTCSHPPRHNDVPIWPRGNLGLPIVGRFQTFGRGGTPYKEPPPFMIYWFRRGEHAGSFERLASPLIVKALPLANGQFVPMALWFERGYPAGGEMGLYSKDRRTFVPGSLAPFDQLEAPRDTALFTILSGSPAVSGLRLRGVFFNWLGVRFGARRIAP